MYKLYFEDKVIHFVSDVSDGDRAIDRGAVIDLHDDQQLTITKVLQNLENNKHLTIKCPALSGVYGQFCAQFRRVEAAGGVVRNQQGMVLMIHRNGRWDLPKGHMEQGESHAECAVREVKEECGLSCIELGESVGETMHFYELRGEWVMKHTEWFEMFSDQHTLRPQTEEGIAKVLWVSAKAAAGYAAESYASIGDLMSGYLERVEK